MPKNSKGKDVAEVISSKCSGCQICIAECAFDAIVMEDGVALIDPEKCTGCTLCVSSCPSDAIIFSRPVRKRSSQASAEANGTWRGIAVLLEYKSGKVADVSWELTGKAREMAEKMGTEVIGFILGGMMPHAATLSPWAATLSTGCRALISKATPPDTSERRSRS